MHQDQLRDHLQKVGTDLPQKFVDYQHMEYVGVGSVGFSEENFGVRLLAGIEGLYHNGFAKGDIDPALLAELVKATLIMPAFHDPQRLQLAVASRQDLDRLLEERGLAHRLLEIQPFFDNGTRPSGNVTIELIEKLPELAPLKDAWESDQTGMRQFTLTSVGIALGHAYFTRMTGDTSKLSIWL
jgi:hypothetical protein